MKKIAVIYHSGDFDGIFCREIAKKFYGMNAEYIGWDFKDAPLPFPDKDTHYVVMDLPLDRPFGLIFADGYLCRGEGWRLQAIDLIDWTQWTWIDHHKSSIESHPKRIIPGYQMEGVAACRLAWQWFFDKDRALYADKCWTGGSVDNFINRTLSEPYAVQLAGEYDIWDKRNPDADVFQFGLRSMHLNMNTYWPQLLSLPEVPPVMHTMLANGRIIQAYQQEADATAVNELGFLIEFDGLKFLALNTPRINTNTFTARDVIETGHDALMGFFWNGKEWTVSLRQAKHRKDLDLSKIAVKHGGGGHLGSCGFKCKMLPYITNGTNLNGVGQIYHERIRQQQVEGWTAEHDDGHNKGEMAVAAIGYISTGAKLTTQIKVFSDPRCKCGARGMADCSCVLLSPVETWQKPWPWGNEYFKPKDPVRDLVRAGALIAGEIDRLERLNKKT
jgi:hypothetical protein